MRVKTNDSRSASTDNVIRLDPPGESLHAQEAEPVTPPGRGHGLAILGMALCAVIAIATLLTFITIRWPGDAARYVQMIFVAAGAGFMFSASAAVFFAMRDTYAVRIGERPNDRSDD